MRRWPEIALGRFRLVLRRHFFLGRVVRQWYRLSKEVVGSPSLELFRKHRDVAHGDVSSGHGRDGVGLGISEVLSNLNASMDLLLLLCISGPTPHSPAHTNIHPCASLPVWSLCQLNLGWVQGAVSQALCLHVSPSPSVLRLSSVQLCSWVPTRVRSPER